jgi:beta-mannanase
MLRFNHEMNGWWFPWAEGRTSTGVVNGNSPGDYVKAWRHVHDIFTRVGATNVSWLWSPNIVAVNTNYADLASVYPGDAYVDWTGVDGYNWGTSDPDFDWQSFADVFGDIYPKLAAKGKPIIIGEMASDEVGGSKAQWIDDIIPTLKTRRHGRSRSG